jgi:biotin operon repressor
MARDINRQSAKALDLAKEDRSELERWVRARTTPQRLVQRSRIVLLAADGVSDREIAERLGTTRSTVRLWRMRFARGGPDVLMHDAPGRGRKPRVSATAISEALRNPTGEPLSVRQLARKIGASSSAVHRALARRKKR